MAYGVREKYQKQRNLENKETVVSRGQGRKYFKRGEGRITLHVLNRVEETNEIKTNLIYWI